MVDQNQGYNIYQQQEAALQAQQQAALQQQSQQYINQINALGFGVSMPQGWQQTYSGAQPVGTLAASGSVPGNWYQQAYHDFTGDAKNDITGKGGASGAFAGGIAASLGGVNPVAAFRGRSNWRSNQASENARITNAQNDYQAMQNALAGQQQTNQTAYNDKVAQDMSTYAASQFNNPSRQAYYNTIYNTDLNNGLAQVNNAYKGALTSSAEQAADRGLLGGTVDTQARANLAASRDQGAAQVGQAAQAASQGARQQDQSTLAQLQGLINSGNPTTQAQAAAQLQQLGAGQQNLLQQGQNAQSGWNMQQWLTQLNSQGLGGFAGAANNGAQQQLGNMAASGNNGGLAAAANSPQAWTGMGYGST